MASTSDIVMPKLGLTMTEGILAEWKVQPGSAVRAGDTLFVVETEKVANDIEADRDGVIEVLLVQAGATVPVGSPLARFRATNGAPMLDDANKDEVPAAIADPEPRAQAAAMSAKSELRADGRAIATPYARRLARERGIDVKTLRGSGPRGRIKAADVERAVVSATPTPESTPATGPGSSHYHVLLKIDGARLIELQAMAASALARAEVPLAAFIAMAAARAAATIGFDTQSDAITISTRSGVVTIDRTTERRLGELAALITNGDPERLRNSESAIEIVDLEIEMAEFFAPPIGPQQVLTIGIASMQSGVLRLSLAVRGDVGAERTAALADAISRNLEHPWAMLV
jgi:pyruvate/2-oxoglutarate dehydrogenase complex dihydrolipoamide acyltransferase (E2) component